MGNSHSESDKVLFSMRNSLRKELGTNIGILAKTKNEMISHLIEGNIVASVGDVVTLDLLESGIVPDLSIVDYMTKRMPMSEVKERFSKYSQPEIIVDNPPGQITKALWEAIQDGYRNPRKLRIVIRGEEDLAALACIALAPEKTTIIYGIPGSGVSINHVDRALRQLVNDVLDTMKVK
jgi:uncharacterized protein (UPF0218 family)